MCIVPMMLGNALGGRTGAMIGGGLGGGIPGLLGASQLFKNSSKPKPAATTTGTGG